MTNEYFGVYPVPTRFGAPPTFGLTGADERGVGTIVLSPYGLLFMKPYQKAGQVLSWREVVRLIEGEGTPMTQDEAEDRPQVGLLGLDHFSDKPLKFLGEDD